MFIPGLILGTCLISLLFITLLTNPLSNISYTLLAFFLILLALISLGYLLIAWAKGKVSKKARSRIVIASIILVFLAMFKSSGSLGWVDLVVTLLLAFGLLFYSGRRGA